MGTKIGTKGDKSMATPKKRYKYTFLYTDQTYLTYELTREDFEKVEQGLTGNNPHPERAFIKPTMNFVAVSIGVIGLDGVRSVIEQKEEEPQVDEEGNPLELPVLDQESYNWIKQYIGGDTK